MSFNTNKYEVIKNVIGSELSAFLFNYLKLKKESTIFLKEIRYLSPFDSTQGWFDDPQAPNTFSMYGDMAMDNLLSHIKPMVEKETRLDLCPTYSYTRLYKTGDELVRHKDRKSCEISATMNLGGDDWPIFLEPSGEENKSGVKIDLGPGDILIYSGCDLEHWREKFTGSVCGQVFLHYNKKNDKDNQKYDNRRMLGLPSELRNYNV